MLSGALAALLLFQTPAQRASALVDAGVELSNRGQFAEAAEKFVQALALDPHLAEAHYLIGLIRQEGGRQDAALESFRAAVKLRPGYAQAQARVCEIETARAVARESGYETALASCTRAIALDPRDAEPHFHAGSIESKRRRYSAAVNHFAAALRRGPRYPHAKYELAMSYIEARNLARGIPLLKEVVAAEPGHGNARFQLGSALAKAGDCAGALPHLEAATQASQTYYLLAGCYRKLGRESDAASAMARMKELREGADAKTRAQFRAAVAHKKAEAGLIDEAIAEYRAAYDLSPDPSIATDLAVALLKKGEAQQVLSLLGTSSDPLAQYQVALAQIRLGRHAEARAALEAAVGQRPRFAEAWYQLGVTLLMFGDGASADRALRAAVELRPDDAAVRHAWADALDRNGRAQDAAAQRGFAALLTKAGTAAPR